MNQHVIPAAHTILDAVALGEAINAHYGLGTPFVCELLHRGMNDFYLVRAAGKKYVAQVWRPGTTPVDKVDYQMDFMLHLDAGGIPLPVPQRGADGSGHLIVAGPEGERPVALFRFVEGKAFSSDPTASVSRKMGVIFGQIHKLSEGWDRTKEARLIDREKGIASSFPYLEKLAAHRPDDLAYYREVADAVTAGYRTVRTAGNVPSGAIHGDFHIHNAFVRANDDVTIMDFDACGLDYFAQELMSYRWSIEKNDLPMSLWEVFLEGYETVRPLSDLERSHIPLFLVGKEFQYLCGFSRAVNAIGHVAFHFPGFDWFAESVRRHVDDAKLL
ncbi:MAG: phosphotransferase [Alphaproteobacteria bacterium]